MKNYCLISYIFFILFSCGKSQDIDNTSHSRIIQNNSDHSIIIKRLKPFKISITPNDVYETKTCEKGHTLPITFGYLSSETDSLVIIYDDTLAIFHGSKKYTVLRDLRKNEMYPYKQKRVDKTIQYTYTYTFTNADYDEAKTK